LPLAYSQELSFVPNWRESGRGAQKLLRPEGIALDQEGNIYVADTANNRIQVLSSNGTFISRWGGYGGTGGNGTLRFPIGIAVRVRDA
jgi:DNA-binding beta-propeller fold protein YncE